MRSDHRCALYVRVSTARQASVQEGSLDAQLKQLQAYIAFENGASDAEWAVADVYREEGKSGKDLRRPEFTRMMGDIQAGRIGTVVVWKIDRLTRSLSDFSKVWQTFEDRGVQLISLNEKLDTESALGRAMLKIILVFAELEREQTGERTSATMAHRATQGMWNGGRVVGYDPDPESKGGLAVNREFAEVVRLAFNACIERGSAGAAMRLLNERGYRTPTYTSRRGKQHGGAKFTKQAVIRMLGNPVYTGHIKWGEGIFAGLHEPIISKDAFRRVQEILEQNRRHPGNRRRPKRHRFILKGLVRCGKCGAMMSPAWGTNGSGKPYHYYQCTRRQHQGRQGCDSRSVPAEALERLVTDRLQELATDECEVTRMVDEANAKQTETLGRLRQHTRQLERRLQTVIGKLDSLVAAVEGGGAEAFRRIAERMEDLERERTQLEDELVSLEFETSRIEEESLSAEAMARTFTTFGEVVGTATPKQLGELIPLVVEVIEWNEDPENPGSGHYKIAYFEQPHLDLYRETPTEHSGECCSVGGNDWLPGEDSNLKPSG